MEDLSSVGWDAPKAVPAAQQHSYPSGNYYPALRTTPPISGRSTPAILHRNHSPLDNGITRNSTSTPANDSFASLVSFNDLQSAKGSSLQEQQKKLQEEKARQEWERNQAFHKQFGDSQAPPSSRSGGIATKPAHPPTYTATSEYGGQKLSKAINKPFANIPLSGSSPNVGAVSQDENDLLAAFDASAPVDRSSHMPETSRSSSATYVDIGGSKVTEDVDDDPFELGPVKDRTPIENHDAGKRAFEDEDDVLGPLSRPVEDFVHHIETNSPSIGSKEDSENYPQERAVGELVEMGFAPERSRQALETTESGIDVQSAVGWLLKQAHDDSRKQKRPKSPQGQSADQIRMAQARMAPGRRSSPSSESARPAWMRNQSGASQNRTESKSPMNGDKDPAQYAAELGNKMFKTAGSLWKTSTKKLNQAVQDFNSDSDSSQPKWMREAQAESGARKPRTQHRTSDVHNHDRMKQKPQAPAQDRSVTDEALLLEADARPARKSRLKPDPLPDRTVHEQEQAPARSRPSGLNLPPSNSIHQVPAKNPAAKLSKQAIDEATSQVYISPARRRRTTPKPQPAEAEPDLIQSSRDSTQPRVSPVPPISHPSRPPSVIANQPTAPKRNVPSLSSFALKASTKGRQEGNSAFKRGDYAQATLHYSSSLSAVPSTHPLAIVILTNRALSQSKTGDPKASMADAKSALDLIGLTRGVGETIDLGGDEGSKQMNVYWEKAMMRQAEALEHLERWSDAAAIWRTCVEAGVGGATSSAGRIRCEKAAAPPSQEKTSLPSRKPLSRPRPKPTALGDLAPDSESVTRLRAANAAAERMDDEKFALADVVDQRVSRWRAGKEGNLRALLSTLENVLWEDSGWKKVGMGDVLLPGKVKIVYMKGIAKVHPDKVRSVFYV